MKAAIRFIEPDNKLAILTKLLDIIQGIEQLRQHVLTHGILLENLSSSEVEALKDALRKLDYSDYTATENSLRLKIARGDLGSLVPLLITIPGFGNEFAEMFWERGFSIEKLTAEHVDDLKRRLEPIAIVTITPDVIDTPQPFVYTVSGQVRKQDGTPLTESGFTVHVFDSVSPNNLVPLGSVALSPQASYHLSYAWKSDGRNGPNLIVRLVNPQGEIVEEVRYSLAPAQAVLNITVKNQQPQSFVLTAHVKNQETGKVLPNAQVEAKFRTQNTMLQTTSGTTNSEGVALIPFDESVFKDVPTGQNVEVVFGVQREGQAVETNTTIPNLQLKNQEVEILTVTLNPSSNVVVGGNRIKGTIFLEYGVPATKLKLRLYRRDFGGKETQLAETFTSNDGQYAFAYSAGSKTGSLEIRAVKGESEEIRLSRPLNDLGKESDSLLTLIAPATLQPAEAEYQRLSADLIPHVEQMRNLAEARENKERQDITVLNRATGWDARLIALAATAERLNADAEVNLPPEPLYGLLRAGLPSEKLMLAQVNPDVAEQALKVVRDKGIVQLTDDQIGQFKKEFVAFSNETRLSIPAPGSHSTYRELLQISGLGNDAQNKFASAYLNYHGDPTGLWEEVRKAGLDDTQISKLQLQGKLAFLAANSREMTVSLMNRLANNEAVRDPVQLVEQDFYEADQWKREITTLAGNDQQKLAALIPAAYISEKLDDRLDAYAEDMGRKLRVSYPTQVVSRMIERDKIKLSAAKDPTAKLLKSAAGQGFRLGETPVETFFKTHTGVTAGMEGDEIDAAKQQIKTLQTVYQITPSNDAMTVLIASGMTSAYHVTAYPQKEFVAKYEREYIAVFNFPPPSEEPLLIYRKARQVSSVTYNLFTMARKMGSDLPVAGMSTPVELLEAARSEIIKHFPTMESLFGSMDFCECEHCRSVLSPAAYLVDLLQFIDTEAQLWDDFLRGWSEKHNGQEYPHKGKNGLALKAYDVLVERRPDLPHIPLTCENTHTILPYIDIVNEILEYYVANGQLAEEAAHDTGGATTQDLLAEPQNVIREAYDKLDEARYPLNLPFDLWLETVRQFCNYFDAPLEGILDIFRASDDLFAPAQPFDRNNIFIESLRISPAEWAIFVATDHLVDDKWYSLYGLPTLRPVIENSTNDTQGVISIANAAADAFQEGFACTYFDVSTASLSNESNIILTIGEADSGGPSLTSITFKDPWNTNPERGDLLVLDAIAILKSAKTLSRRLSVTYKEIVRIVQTGFVNPGLAAFAILDKLGVSISDLLLQRDFKHLLDADSNSTEVNVLVGPNGMSEMDRRRYESLKVFQSRISSFEKSTGFDVNSWLDEVLSSKAFDDTLLLVDPDTGCNFDLTTLRYASGNPADAIVFLKINLFVRLWRKLGWSIEETDRALRTFIPKNAPFDKDPGNLRKQPLKTALIYLAHLKFMDEKLRLGKQSRFKLIPLWSDMGTDARDSLYAQLFLTPALLKSGAVEVVVDGKKSHVSVFDSPIGRYLDPADLKQMSEQVHYEVSLQNIKNEKKIEETLFAGKPRLSLRYDELAEVQYLSYVGTLTEQEKQDLIAIARSDELITLLDAVQAKATEFMLVRGHILTLQGALGLTTDEIRQILVDAGHSMETAPLSLPVVSLLYRYGLLAKALKLPVNELITLKQLSDLDPFKLLNGDPLSTLSEDNPYTQTLRFVEIVEEVKDSGLTIEDLNYLLRHRFDETGKYRPTTGITLAFIKTIGEGVRAIRTEHAMPSDPAQLSEEVLRQKLVLALAPDVAERFVAMVNGTVEFTSARPGVDAMNALKPEQFSSESRIRQISYKEVPDKEQKLTLRGVLFATEKADLESRVGTALSMDQQSVLSDLLEGVRAKAREFFDNNFKKQPLKADGQAGFFDETDFDVLFRHLKEPQKIEPDDTEEIISAKKSENEKIEQENQKDLEARRFHIAQVFLPFLQQRLIRQFVTETLTAHTGADRVLVESLLNDARLLGTTKPLLESFTATDARGITATFSAASDGTGPTLTTVFLPEADTAFKDQDGNFMKPAEANSARFEGYLEVPVPGAYRFYVKLEKQDAEAELRFAHLPSPLPIGTAMANSDEVDIGYFDFQPGLPYRFTLDLRKLNGGHAHVLVQGETLPKRSLSQLILYPLVTVDQAEQGLLLLTKTLQLSQGFGLSEREARYLLTHGAAFENLDFNKLPSRDAQSTLEMLTDAKRETNPDLSKQEALELTRTENPSLAAEADHPSQLFKQFLRLASYVRLKRDLAGNTDDLIEIFEANEAPEPAIGEKLNKKIYPLIAMLTRRDHSTVKITAKILFGDSPVFASEIPLQRLWDALQVIEKFGVSAVSLRDWTRIVSVAAPPAQRFEIARNLKEALKARFDREAWQRIAQPIFDKLRQRQRDALASHIMHQQGFSRVEQLYEYFLIDPGMEPVVQTSRIRLAISSVQLFIQRCLLNLEIKVNPSVINTKQWEWMKRYRVWEANRKIFLFPENWLEPEFRDDKTHPYLEMEGALLQGDVSSDLVEDAFLNYMRKLDELARLDIVAMHIEDNADRTLHVFGRTFSGPHKYFYRRYIRQIWTPWEPVRAEIQGDHLAPVVWRDRLYLFWVTFMDMPDENAQTDSITSGTPLINADLQSLMSDLRAAGANKQINIQLHWSEYLNSEWSSGESSQPIIGGRAIGSAVDAEDPSVAVWPMRVLLDFDPDTVSIHVSKDFSAGVEQGVYVHLEGGRIALAFYLAGRNSPPEVRGYGEASNGPKPGNPYGSADETFETFANRYLGRGQLNVTFQERITTEAAELQSPSNLAILRQQHVGYTLLPCDNSLATIGTPEIASLTQPVFYQDNANTFFIEPSLTERTVEEWREWVVPPPQSSGDGGFVIRDEWWDRVTPAFPEGVKDPRPDVKMPPILVSPESLIKLRESYDWLVNSGTGLIFDDVLLGPKGQSGLQIIPIEDFSKGVAAGNQVNVRPGSALAAGSAVIVSDVAVAGQFDQTQMAKGMNVIGSSGFNSTMMTRNSGNSNSLSLSTGTVNANRSFIR